MVLILYTVVLAETNRSPFDFAEGESELVSGYNVEFSGPGFVLLFLSEYLSILFIAFLTGSLARDCTFFVSVGLGTFAAFTFIWARGTLPRFRYDQLIGLSWKSLLPTILSSFILILSLYYPLSALKASLFAIMHFSPFFLFLLRYYSFLCSAFHSLPFNFFFSFKGGGVFL